MFDCHKQTLHAIRSRVDKSSTVSSMGTQARVQELWFLYPPPPKTTRGLVGRISGKAASFFNLNVNFS